MLYVDRDAFVETRVLKSASSRFIQSKVSAITAPKQHRFALNRPRAPALPRETRVSSRMEAADVKGGGFWHEKHFRLVTSAATALATILEFTLRGSPPGANHDCGRAAPVLLCAWHVEPVL